MQANLVSTGGASFSGSPAATAVLGTLSAVIVVAAVADASLPVLGTGRWPFLALVVLGVVLCTMGGAFYTQLGATHPTTIAGMVLGVASLAIIVSALAGWTAFLQPIANGLGSASVPASIDRAAIVALGGVMAVKWLIGWIIYLPR